MMHPELNHGSQGSQEPTISYDAHESDFSRGIFVVSADPKEHFKMATHKHETTLQGVRDLLIVWMASMGIR